MKSIPLENPDVRFGAPPNWNHETDGVCHTLDVWRRDGAWISGWVPSAAELAGTVMKEAVKRSGVDPKSIIYVTVGN